MKRCPRCQSEITDEAQFCNRCEFAFNQVSSPIAALNADKTIRKNPQAGSFLPPWLWVWLILYPIIQWSALRDLWDQNVQQLRSPDLGLDFLFLLSQQSMSLSGYSTLVQLFSIAALTLGLLNIFLPWLRTMYIERRYRLTDANVEILAMHEIRRFVAAYAPNIRIKTNLLRTQQFTFIYPLGYRTTALAIFGGMIKLWRSDRQAAEAVLLHEIAHYRHGDTLIFGAGSFFETVVIIWLPLYFLVVLFPEVLALYNGRSTLLAMPNSSIYAIIIAAILLGILTLLRDCAQSLILFFIPLVGIWCVELNADRFVIDIQHSSTGLLRALDHFSPLRGRLIQRILFRTSHPPVHLRRWFAHEQNQIVGALLLLLIFPLGWLCNELAVLVQLLATDFSIFTLWLYTKWVVSLEKTPSPLDQQYVLLNHQYYLQDIHDTFTGFFQGTVLSGIQQKLIPMLLLLLLWPLLVQYWERLFCGRQGMKSAAPWKIYFYSVLSIVGVSLLFWALCAAFLLTLTTVAQ